MVILCNPLHSWRIEHDLVFSYEGQQIRHGHDRDMLTVSRCLAPYLCKPTSLQLACVVGSDQDRLIRYIEYRARLFRHPALQILAPVQCMLERAGKVRVTIDGARDT